MKFILTSQHFYFSENWEHLKSNFRAKRINLQNYILEDCHEGEMGVRAEYNGKILIN
jgi:hypothetical protein